MKIFTYILSFYVLMLSAIPCIDVPEDNHLQKTELIQNTNNNHTEGADHCSPFCTCDCCGCPVMPHENLIDFNSFSSLKEYNSNYSSAFISTPSASIWQPPKIS